MMKNAAYVMLMRQAELLTNNITMNQTRRKNLIATEMKLAAEIDAWQNELKSVQHAILLIERDSVDDQAT